MRSYVTDRHNSGVRKFPFVLLLFPILLTSHQRKDSCTGQMANLQILWALPKIILAKILKKPLRKLLGRSGATHLRPIQAKQLCSLLGPTECWVLLHRLLQDSGGRRMKEGEGLFPFPMTAVGWDWGKQQELYLLALCLVCLWFRSCWALAAEQAGRLRAKPAMHAASGGMRALLAALTLATQEIKAALGREWN